MLRLHLRCCGLEFSMHYGVACGLTQTVGYSMLRRRRQKHARKPHADIIPTYLNDTSTYVMYYRPMSIVFSGLCILNMIRELSEILKFTVHCFARCSESSIYAIFLQHRKRSFGNVCYHHNKRSLSKRTQPHAMFSDLLHNVTSQNDFVWKRSHFEAPAEFQFLSVSHHLELAPRGSDTHILDLW